MDVSYKFTIRCILTNSYILNSKQNFCLTTFLSFHQSSFTSRTNTNNLMLCTIVQCQVVYRLYFLDFLLTHHLEQLLLLPTHLFQNLLFFVCRQLLNLNLSGTLAPEIGNLSYLEIV